MNLIDLADIHAAAMGIEAPFHGALLLGDAPPQMVRPEKITVPVKRHSVPGELTDRQKEALRYVSAFAAEKGFPPSLREIAKALGVRSVQGAKHHMEAIERKGFIRREPGARSITILKRA